MSQLAIAALEGILRPHVALGKSRLETLCLLIVGMVSARTVNLAHIACERPGPAQTASTYRRLQRFFQHVRLERDWALPLVARLVGSGRRWTLVLDRTNWANGTEVNYLVLAIVTRRFRVPLAWTVAAGQRQQLDRGAHRADQALPRPFPRLDHRPPARGSRVHRCRLAEIPQR